MSKTTNIEMDIAIQMLRDQVEQYIRQDCEVLGEEYNEEKFNLCFHKLLKSSKGEAILKKLTQAVANNPPNISAEDKELA